MHAELVHSYRLTVPLGPVGGVPEDGVTVAVRLTDWPKLDGFGVLVSTVVVGAWLTVWVSVVDELMAKLVGSVAVKVAKTAWDPTESDEVAYVARPLALTVSAGLRATLVTAEAGDPEARLAGFVHW